MRAPSHAILSIGTGPHVSRALTQRAAGKETAMTVRVTARHFELTDDIKQHIENRSRHFERFVQNIVDLHWTLDIDKHRNIAEVSALVHGATLTGHSEAADLRSAIDDTAEKMEAQLRKHKGRLKEKDSKAIAEAKASAMRNGEPSDD